MAEFQRLYLLDAQPQGMFLQTHEAPPAADMYWRF
jgi:hypothetical protein